MQFVSDLEPRLIATISELQTNDGSHDLAHLRRVRANSLHIAETEPAADRRVLIAAVWLHDAIHMEKSDPRRAQASRMAAEFARDLLGGWGEPKDFIEAVAHAIEAHSYSANIPPQTIEAKILRDADRLDAIGAIGVARCFYVTARLNRSLYDPDDPWAKERPLDESRFGIDHFPIKLLKLEAGMLTETGKRIARHRTAYMQGFLDELAAEISS
jgi:uncharacterized protein